MAKIPIQERDTINSAASPTIRDTSSPVKVFDQGLIDTAQKVLTESERRRKQADDDAEQLAQAKFDNDVYALSKKSTVTLAGAEGENALTLYDVEKESLSRGIKKTLQGVDPKWQAKFGERGRKSLIEFEAFGAGHTLKEGTALADKTYKTSIENSMEQAVLNSTNSDMFEQKLVDMGVTATTYLRKKLGGDLASGQKPSKEVEQAIQYSKDKLYSTATKQSIEQFASMGAIDQVRSFFKKHGDNLLAEDREAVNKIMNKAEDINVDNIALNLSQQAAAAHPDNIVDAMAFIARESKDGKVVFRASGNVRSHFGDMATQKKADNDRKLQGAYDSVIKTKNIPKELLDSLEPADKIKMKKFVADYNNGLGVVTDIGEYTKLDDMARDRPIDFKNVQLHAYKHVLSQQDWMNMKGRQDRAKAAETSQQASIQHSVDKSIGDIVGGVMAVREMDSLDVKEKGEISLLARQIYNEVLIGNPKETNPNVIRGLVQGRLLNEVPPAPGRRGYFKRLLQNIGLIDTPEQEIPKAKTIYGDGAAPTPAPTPTPTPKPEINIDNVTPEFLQSYFESRGNLPKLEGDALKKRLRDLVSRGVDISRPLRKKGK